jgi:putative transposase
MADLSGAEFEAVFHQILPEPIIRDLAKRLGVVERERELDIAMFARAMVIGGQTHEGGRQADMLRAYAQSTGTEPARSGFYRRFDAHLDAFSKALLEHGLEQVREETPLLPGILGGVIDWRAADSTTVRLRDSKALKEQYPGTGDYAAIKVHKIYSVGRTLMVDYHFSPAREHDSKHLTIDESWRGHGLLADLGYASLARLRDCERHGVKYVIRLKEGWKPKVDRIARGEVQGAWMEGSDLDLLLEQEILVLKGKVIDADAWLGSGANPLPVRIIGVRLPNGRYGFYLTNLPRSTHGPKQVATLYRLRWEIESDNKLDKSCHKLDKVDALTPESVRIVLRAALLASLLVNLIVHRSHVKEGLRSKTKVRTTAPLHPMALARMLGAGALLIAHAMRPDATDPDRWNRIARGSQGGARDPNWRHAPSIHDLLRGYTSPGPKRRIVKNLAKTSPSAAT